MEQTTAAAINQRGLGEVSDSILTKQNHRLHDDFLSLFQRARPAKVSESGMEDSGKKEYWRQMGRGLYRPAAQ